MSSFVRSTRSSASTYQDSMHQHHVQNPSSSTASYVLERREHQHNDRNQYMKQRGHHQPLHHNLSNDRSLPRPQTHSDSSGGRQRNSNHHFLAMPELAETEDHFINHSPHHSRQAREMKIPHQYQYYQDHQEPPTVASTERPILHPSNAPEFHQHPELYERNPSLIYRREENNHHLSTSHPSSSLFDFRSTPNSLPPLPKAIRIPFSQNRTDPAGKEYTAYTIQALPSAPHLPHESHNLHQHSHHHPLPVEHRYSDFDKLRKRLVAFQPILATIHFPSKSWMGRVGPWSPSKILTPQQHEGLIEERMAELESWMNEILEQDAVVSNPRAQFALHEFLTSTSSSTAPCQQAHAILKASFQPHSDSSTENAVSTSKWWNPLSFSMGSALRQACWMCDKMVLRKQQQQQAPSKSQTLPKTPSHKIDESPQAVDQSIPVDLLRAAHGILFLTVAKGGLVVSGRVGTGLLVKRLPHEKNGPGWSAPVAMGIMGVGWGALVGGDVTHYIVILTTDKAVMDLVQHDNAVQLGAELSVAVGPIGRGAQGHVQSGDWTLHPAYAYAHSQGLFVGMSIEGSFLKVRPDVNASFYGSSLFDADELLATPGPRAAWPLYQLLNRALDIDLHRHSFRPTQLLNLPQDADNIEYHVQKLYNKSPLSEEGTQSTKMDGFDSVHSEKDKAVPSWSHFASRYSET